jgi:flagellin
MSSLRISASPAALSAQRNLIIAQGQTNHALNALSSGSRIVNAGDDPAGFAIGETLRAQISGTKQAKNNAADAESMIQVAEGSLNEQNNILIRLRELGVQSASDSVSDNERGFINQEFKQLQSEFDRIAKTTRFGAQTLLNGAGKSFEFQVGAFNDSNNRIQYNLDADTTAGGIGIDGLDVSDQDSARDSLDSIDEAVNKIGEIRANFGAIQSRLEIAQNHSESEYVNLSDARSRIVDADVAEETTKLAQAQILQSAGISVLAQANQDSERVLKLLN